MESKDILKLNIGGTKLEISQMTWSLIKRSMPLDSQCKLLEHGNEVFLERNVYAFRAILDYYLHGNLHMPPELCPSSFKLELDFWGIEHSVMETCCYHKYVSFFENKRMLQTLEMEENKCHVQTAKLTAMTRCQGWKKTQASVWLFLNEPFSSISAKIYFGLSSLVVAMSLFILIAGTHPEFQRSLHTEEWQDYYSNEWYKYKHLFIPAPEPGPEPQIETSTEIKNEPLLSQEVGVTEEPLPEAEYTHVHVRYSYLVYGEYVSVTFFTIDLIVRVVFCPFRQNLLFSFLNWVDIFALAVTYATYIVQSVNPREKYETSVIDILHCLQIVRVFRLFRVVKNFVGFRVLLYAFKASILEVLLMMSFLLVAMLFFSAFAFFSGDETFPSIPDSFWWAVVTMTTVGYGDVVPKTGLSKLVGSLCAVAGVCLLAVLIPVFVNNFLLFYAYSKVWDRKQKAVKHDQNVKPAQVKTTENHKVVQEIEIIK